LLKVSLRKQFYAILIVAPILLEAHADCWNKLRVFVFKSWRRLVEGPVWRVMSSKACDFGIVLKTQTSHTRSDEFKPLRAVFPIELQLLDATMNVMYIVPTYLALHKRRKSFTFPFLAWIACTLCICCLHGENTYLSS